MIASGSLAAPTTELADIVAPVLAEELYWFPVRHHSPAAAHNVSKAIAKRKPRCVLIEAPVHLQYLLPFLLDKTKPPVALYSSARLDTGQTSARAGTSWYPLLEYSPEWQAIQAAHKIGAEILFIDLPHYCQPKNESESPADSVSFFQSLADQAGYLNWHECWDSLFEHSADFDDASSGFENFRQQLLYFSAAARHQANVDESESLLARECYMWGNIQAALQRFDAKDTMVVCGGLHIFMPRDESGFSALQALVITAEKELSLNTTIVPYSYRRVAMQHGYAAGNRAPWFYYQLWRNREKPDRILIEHVRKVLSIARNLGQTISAADNLAVAHHAKLLAQLRNREQPVLDDIEDAVWACCCKGDPEEQGAHIAKAMERANIGARIGTVNPLLGQLPLVKDFYAQLHLLGLDLPSQDENKTIECDLRTAEGLARSQFLHRLQYLQLPCALKASQQRVYRARLFSEKWTLAALGNQEMLIECSEYGDTIESVVQSKITTRIEQQLHDLCKLAATLLDSQVMGLGVFHADIAEHFQVGLQQTGDFITLTSVFQSLLKIWNQQKFLDSVEPAAEPLLALCFLRSSLVLGKVRDVSAENQSSFVDGLRVMAEAWLSMAELNFDRDLFEQELVTAASTANSPLVHGCCFGLLLESGKRDVADFIQQLDNYTTFGSSDALINAAIWIEGVMYTTKVSMLNGSDKVSHAIDALLRRANQDEFLIMLPRLRSGFVVMPKVQRDALAVAVAQMYGLKATDNLKQLPTNYREDLSALDKEVQAIMNRWGLST